MAAFFMGTRPAAAQQQMCGERNKVIDLMKQHSGIEPKGVGQSQEGHLLELLTNPATGQWVVMISFPNGTSCYFNSGDNWKELKQGHKT